MRLGQLAAPKLGNWFAPGCPACEPVRSLPAATTGMPATTIAGRLWSSCRGGRWTAGAHSTLCGHSTPAPQETKPTVHLFPSPSRPQSPCLCHLKLFVSRAAVQPGGLLAPPASVAPAFLCFHASVKICLCSLASYRTVTLHSCSCSPLACACGLPPLIPLHTGYPYLCGAQASAALPTPTFNAWHATDVARLCMLVLMSLFPSCPTTGLPPACI